MNPQSINDMTRTEVSLMLEDLDKHKSETFGHRLMFRSLLRHSIHRARLLREAASTASAVVCGPRVSLLEPGQFWTKLGGDVDVVCVDRDVSMHQMQKYEGIPQEYHENACLDPQKLLDLNVELHAGDDTLIEDTVLPRGTCVALTKTGHDALRDLIQEGSAAMPMHLIDECPVFELSTPQCGAMFSASGSGACRSSGDTKRSLPSPPPPPPPPPPPNTTPPSSKRRKLRKSRRLLS